jgi:hypothetical protein
MVCLCKLERAINNQVSIKRNNDNRNHEFDKFLANLVVYKENVRVKVVVQWQARLFFMTQEIYIRRIIPSCCRLDAHQSLHRRRQRFGNFAILTKKRYICTTSNCLPLKNYPYHPFFVFIFIFFYFFLFLFFYFF